MAKRLTLKNQTQGQSLLELVFAISIVGLILGGFVSAIVYFSKTGQVAESGTKATQLAQEKIEELRGERKSSPSTFWQYIDSVVDSSISEDLEGGKYTRVTTFQNETPENENRKIMVEVEIQWQEQGQPKNTVITTYFNEY